MFGKSRQELFIECKEILEENPEIRTQGDFAKIYSKKYQEDLKKHFRQFENYKDKEEYEISQAAVSRMFRDYHIKIDSETGFYRHMSNDNSKSEDEDYLSNLKIALESYSYGNYTHEKGVPAMWLSVAPHSEEVIANAIIDYVGYENVSIICGVACLWVKCTNMATYNSLSPILKSFS